jgi:2-polyprenyl-6-methoxyphenol hydroxylase-like FAD-dependent oxidoreductase
VHGITDALRDAELLARAILDGGDATHLTTYESERDRISQPLFDVTDKIASRNWTMPEVKTLLREMNDSMVDELTVLEGLDSSVASCARRPRV